MIKKKPKLSRAEINEQSRLLKRKKKHKGLPSGSRINQVKSTLNQMNQTVSDARIGSKKPIPLIINDDGQSKNKNAINHAPTKARKLLPEQELQELENDPYLEKLLDSVENDQALTEKQQHDLDIMLDRIDLLMKKLGYIDEEDLAEQTDSQDDIVRLLKKH